MNWIITKMQTVEGWIGAFLAFCGTVFGLYKFGWPKVREGYVVASAMVNIVDTLAEIRKEMKEGFTALEEGLINRIEESKAMQDANEKAAYFRTDAHGKFTWVSKTWSRWTNMDGHAARGSGWELAIAPEERARVVMGWEQATDHQRDYEDTWVLVDRFSQHRLKVIVQAHASRKKNGEIMDYFGIIHLPGADAQHTGLLAPEPK